MKKCQSRLKKTMVFIRKSMCALMGGIWLLGGVSTGADVEGGACDSNHECVSNEKIANAVITIRTLQAGVESGCPRCKAALASLADTLAQANAPASDVSALHPHGNAALTDEEIVSRVDKGSEECKHRLPSVKEHRCLSNDEVKSMVRGGAVERELKRGAYAGCARCKANLNWFNKHNHYHRADAVQHIELSEHCKSNHAGLSDAAIVEWADKGCETCKSHRALAAHRMGSHDGLNDAAIVEWAAKGCDKCQQHKGDAVQRIELAKHCEGNHDNLSDAVIVEWAAKGCEECKHRLPSVKEHRCPSNDEVKSMVRGGAVERELKRGADAGCARCKANLNWFNKHNHYHRADAVQRIEFSEHCKSNHDGLSDDAIVEWADKGCVKCQVNRDAALQRMAVPEHRCPSNDEVKCMVRGSATEGELKRGADAGCARCKANLNWLNKHNRYHRADAVQRIELSEHCKSNHDGMIDAAIVEWADKGCETCKFHRALAAHRMDSHDGLSDAAIVEWADKGCAKCQQHKGDAVHRIELAKHCEGKHDNLSDAVIVEWAAKGCEECKHRLPSVKEHRCPSNDEVKSMVRGGAVERELKRGADAGCARCKVNLNWFNKYNR